MNRRSILASLLKVYDLPTLPQVIHQIVAITEDEHSSARDLTDLLESDHAISTRVLRLANSAFYGLPQGVDSIRRAVVILGFDAVRNLALATSVVDVFARHSLRALDPRDFWLHSLGAAKAAQMLCERHYDAPSPEGCFTAALLHDLGKYVLALVLGDEYVEITVKAQGDGRLLRDIERERLETDHALVGAWLVERWQFPPMFDHALKHFYCFEDYAGPYRSEVAIVGLANALSRRAGFGDAGDGAPQPIDPNMAEALSLGHEPIKALCQELAGKREQTAAFLEDLKSGQ